MSYIAKLKEQIPPRVNDRLHTLVQSIVKAKELGRGVVICTGSGPNIHEGITTMIAELIQLGVIDGVLTSSAVVAHEMAGALDRVYRVEGRLLGLDPGLLPMDERFEVTVIDQETIAQIEREMPVDHELINKALSLPGDTIIKAAGNMAYPVGLRTEVIARDFVDLARTIGLPLETVVGYGADEHTMLGAGARKGIPVLVTVPQLIGGGAVGLSIADAISVTERCARISRLIDSADIIIESAVALTQELHDGPFETYTGHGIWTAWSGRKTFSLRNKVLARLDLDPNLEKVWQAQRDNALIQQAIARGLPKTKITGIPFRMEMSGFARLENSLPIIGDIGKLWPVLASELAEALDIDLHFVSAPQETQEGQEMREWIVENVKIVDRQAVLDNVFELSRSMGILTASVK